MNRRTRGLKVLGLGMLTALGLMAFTAPAAQATGDFTIGGKTFTALGVKEETVTGKSEGSPAFLVPSINLQLVCEGATISGTLKAGGHGEETMTFSGCKTVKAPCSADPIVAKFLSSIVLHAGETWMRFDPPSGSKAFTTILLLGEECPLPEVNELSGAFIALVGSETVEQLLSFKADEATNKLFGTSYAFGGHPAFLDISALWQLSGPLTGQKWGAQ
jgi:hypothetical protein